MLPNSESHALRLGVYISQHGVLNKKTPFILKLLIFNQANLSVKGVFISSDISLRKMRDSNPRYPKEGIPDFESSAFGHSANLPRLILSDAKVLLFLHPTKYSVYFLTNLTLEANY